MSARTHITTPVAAPPALDLDAIEAAARAESAADAPRCACCGDVATRRQSCGATWCALHDRAPDAPACDCAVTPIDHAAGDVRVALVAEVRRLRERAAQLEAALVCAVEIADKEESAAHAERERVVERKSASRLMDLARCEGGAMSANKIACALRDMIYERDPATFSVEAEVRRLRMELHGAQHALAEASRGRAAASLRAADAEHVATVAMRDGLAECAKLRLMARIARALRDVTLARVEAEASDQLTAATADAVLAEQERDDWESIAGRRDVEGAALASRLRADKAANRMRAEAAEQECARLRAIVEGRQTPPTIREARQHSHVTRGAFVVSLGGGNAHLSARVATGLQRFDATPQLWIALDATGRPCAWPVIDGGESRGGE